MSPQPLMHDETVVLRAPTQAWSSHSGAIGQRAIHGIYLSDVRILSTVDVDYGGQSGEHIATVPHGADRVDFIALLRHLDDRGADPRVRVIRSRSVHSGGGAESLRLESTLRDPVETTVVVRLSSDLADMDTV
ncbi:MAG: amylo-alpha,6-glucosidase, partial [Microbacteriaceae bacterium]|nr:amylo-alpha,6-glucosidase [Microbacteriaceae bacterium]